MVPGAPRPLITVTLFDKVRSQNWSQSDSPLLAHAFIIPCVAGLSLQHLVTSAETRETSQYIVVCHQQ